jgi:hypothetical protein
MAPLYPESRSIFTHSPLPFWRSTSAGFQTLSITHRMNSCFVGHLSSCNRSFQRAESSATHCPTSIFFSKHPHLICDVFEKKIDVIGGFRSPPIEIGGYKMIDVVPIYSVGNG